MNDNSRLYLGTTAFVAGILLTLGFKDLLYPALQQLLRESQPHDAQSRRRRDAEALVARHGPPAIVDGVEGCIGNTPLLRIKSLSEETGCEILGKAEVVPLYYTRHALYVVC